MSQELIFVALISLSIALVGRAIYMASWVVISTLGNRLFNRVIIDTNGAFKVTPWTINSMLQTATLIFAPCMAFGLESLFGVLLLFKFALACYMFIFVPAKLILRGSISIVHELERSVKIMAIILSMQCITGILI